MHDPVMVAHKRDWVPEWLWAILACLRLPWLGYIICMQPFYWMLTEKPKEQK